MIRIGRSTPILVYLCGIATIAAAALAADPTQNGVRQVEINELPNSIGTLRGIKPIEPDLAEYITDKLAAQQLGKAFFWDIQVGSQGVACASCHFHAGADIRTRNQVDPGIKAGDLTFGLRDNGAGLAGPNQTFAAADFPFHKLADPGNREAPITYDTNNVFSSQGSLGGDFISAVKRPPVVGSRDPSYGTLSPTPVSTKPIHHSMANRRSGATAGNENCSMVYDPANPFHVNNLIHRRVEPRQTPTSINAVFNDRQFWDGRANNHFNGVDPFGARTFQAVSKPDGPGNPNAKRSGTLVRNASTGALRIEQRLIANASLASQAVGPPLSDFEMSCSGKSFADLGRKLIAARALANQHIHAADSLLSKGLAIADKGLRDTYGTLVRKAFNPKFWSGTGKFTVTADGNVIADANGYTQMEHNFSLFWGLAILSYESMLVSDDSPFDRAVAGDLKAMTDEAKSGLNVFMNQGGCVNCHHGPLMSGATQHQGSKHLGQVVEHMRVGDGTTAFYDRGFYNIGVRPALEDIGTGATDPYGFDLSYSRQYKWRQSDRADRSPDRFDPTPCKWIFQFWPCTAERKWSDPLSSERDGIDGTFKTPILRNVGLNPPYFHNGGQANLKDLVRFYNRGGDRRGPIGQDTTGTGLPNPFGQIFKSNLSPDIGDSSNITNGENNALKLTDKEMDYLVQFLLSLTDERVACHSGIFDHPELPLTMGHTSRALPGTTIARDIVRVLPAVGSSGLRGIGRPCFPNSGDLFGTVNKYDTAPLQVTFQKILTKPHIEHYKSFGLPASEAAAEVFGGDTSTESLIFPASLPQAGTPTAATFSSRPLPVSIARLGAGGPVVAAADVFGFIPASLISTAPPVSAPVFTNNASKTLRGFTLIGFIQAATVSDTDCPGVSADQRGGTVRINSTTVTIPCNTRLRMPGATLSWSEAVTGLSGSASLALDGRPSASGFSFPSTELRIEGNIVSGRYIAGLVYLSQQTLNSATGVITGFDFANGVLFIGDPVSHQPHTRVELNDPSGRFSIGQSADSRFRVDPANPTIRAMSGYPMCIPRSDPAKQDDPECPQRNRPKAPAGCRSFEQAGVVFRLGVDFNLAQSGYCTGFVMPNPSKALPTEPTALKQAPFQIGDFITVSGTLLYGDRKAPGGFDTISAHTIIASLGIYTEPGTLPVYLAIEDFKIGTFSPNPVVNGVVQEEQDRLILNAMVTDVTSIVDIYFVDRNPLTGAESNRWVTPGSMTGGVGGAASNGQIIDGGITTQLTGPLPGRVRLAAGRAPPGILNSPTRFVRVVTRSLCDPANINRTVPTATGAQKGSTVTCIRRAPAANGILSGQYVGPTTDFIFPETVFPGDVTASNNFWDLGFLVNGEGPGTGRLTPTPW